LGIKRGDVSISQVGNGLIVAKVGFQVPDTSAAKAALTRLLCVELSSPAARSLRPLRLLSTASG